MPNVTNETVEILRKYAVRGELRPGPYRLVYPMNGENPFTTDIYVVEGGFEGRTETQRKVAPGVAWYSCYPLNGAREWERSPQVKSLSDCGVIPMRKGHYEEQSCDLGHVHEVWVGEKYNDNFIVPISIVVAPVKAY